MIELPDWAVPNGAQPALIDFGGILEPSTGAAAQRFDRPGSRWQVQVSLPPMEPDKSRVVIARLVRAKRVGLRIPFPLILDQGTPGSPVIDGAGQAGTTLALRNLQPRWACKEGYWFSIEDAAGQHYLHGTQGNVMIPADGKAVIGIEPPLRAPFADGAKVHMAAPMIEGFVQGNEWDWQIPVNKLVALSFPLREVA